MADEETPSSGFSFLTGPGHEPAIPQSDIVDDMPQEGQDVPLESGVSFVLESSEVVEGDEAPSAFSFLHAGPTEQLDSVDDSRVSEDGSTATGGVGDTGSGFGFLNQSEKAPSTTTSFSFLEPEKATSTQEKLDTARQGAPVFTEAPKEIKLEKVASARNIKKKRRATKVGYARDEDQADEEPVAVNVPMTSGVSDISVVEEESVADPVPGDVSVKVESPERSAPSPLTHAKIQAQVASPVPTQEADVETAIADNTPPTHQPATQVEPHSPTHEKEKKYSFFDMFRRGGAASSDVSPQATKASNISPPVSTKSEKTWSKPTHAAAPTAGAQRNEPTKSMNGHSSSESNGPDMFSGMDTSIAPVQPAVVEVKTTVVASEPASVPPQVKAEPPRQIKTLNQKSKVTETKTESDVCATLTRLGDEIVDQLVAMMGKLSEERQSLLSVITLGLAEIAQLELDIRNYQRDIRDIEARQSQLGEMEDFDAAAALSEPLDNCQRKIEECLGRVQHLDAEVQKAQSLISESHKYNAQDLLHTAKGLGNIRRQKEEEWDKRTKEWEQKYAVDDVAVKGEEERIQLEMTHVLREEESLNEEGAVIETQIAGQTEALSATKTGLESRLHSTLSEIAELELALAAKKADEAEIRNELTKTEISISEVRRKYERQLQRIYDRRTAAVKAQEECSQEVLMIQRERDALELSLADHDRMDSENSVWLQVTEVQIRAVSEFSATMEAVLKLNNDAPVQKENSQDSRITDLKSTLRHCEAALATSFAALEQVKARKVHLAEECDDIINKLPLLESEKKAHAAAKRFKEAASVSKDIKFLSSRKEEADKELILISEDMDRCRATVQTCEDDIAAAKESLKSAERDTDLINFEVLIHKATVLHVGKEKLNCEEYIVDGKIAPMAANILDVELQSCLAEAAELKEKHGIDRSLDTADLFSPPLHPIDEAIPSVDVEGGSIEETSTREELTEGFEDEGLVVDPDAEVTDVLSEDGDDKVDEEIETMSEGRLEAIQEELVDLEGQLQDAVDAEDYDEAAAVSDRIDHLRGLLSSAGVAEL